MTAQPAIFDPILLHARHLFFDLKPGGDCRSALNALFRFTRPLTGGYYWCPPRGSAGIDLRVLER